MVLLAENLVDTEYQVTGSVNKLTGGCCTCGGTEFTVKAVSQSAETVTFMDGEWKAIDESRHVYGTEYTGLLKCRVCGAEYEKAE